MKLTRLTAQDFLGLRKVDMDLADAPVHIVLGRNASGKSSLRDVLTFSLTGCARGVDKKKDAPALARRGGEQMAVTLAWAGGQLRRTASGCSLAERDIASLFGAPEVVNACLCGFHFLDLDLRGRRELVAQVVGSGKQLADELARVCAGAGVDPEMITRLVDEAVKNPAGAEKLAVNRRRELKREVEGLPVTPAPARVTIDGKDFDLTKITVAQVEDRLRQRRAEHDECLRAEGAARLLDTPDILAEKIKALKDGLAAQKECAPELAKYHDEQKKALDRVTRATAKMAAAAAAKDLAAQDITRAGGLKTTCPTCSQKITKQVVNSIIEDAQRRGEEAVASAQEAQTELVAANVLLKKVDAKLFDLKAVTLRREEMTTQVKQLEEDARESQEYAGTTARAAETERSIAVGEKLLAAAQAYAVGRDVENIWAAKTRAIECWDTVARSLAPDGHVRKLASRGFDTGLIQEAASCLLPPAPLEIDEAWNIRYGGVATLSRSERLRLGAGFAAALATAGGQRLICVDEADTLEPIYRKALSGWAQGLCASGVLDNVFIFSTWPTADRPAIPATDGVKMWWAENGMVEPLTGNGGGA
jgi:hypothetical protein